MALLQKMVMVTTIAFFGGFAMTKVMTAMLSPSSRVVML